MNDNTPTPEPMPEGVIEVPFRKSNPAAPQTPQEAGPSKILQVNAGGTPKPQPQPKQIQFKRFENGMVLGFSANPKKPGTYAIHDATGTTYALALHLGVADLICQSVTMLFVLREQKAKEQAEQLDTLSEAAADSHTAEGVADANPAPQS